VVEEKGFVLSYRDQDAEGSTANEFSKLAPSDIIKRCAICSELLECLDAEEALNCYFCGEEHQTRVWCPEGHYVCHACYHMSLSSFIEDMIKTSKSKNPFEIAMTMMAHPSLKQHSCEHAWVFTAAILIAVKNEGTLGLPEEEVLHALEAIKLQANPRFAHSTGVCRMASAVGVAFHAMFNAAFGKDSQDDITMKVVAQAIEYLADESERCKCCKRITLMTLDLVVSLIRARFNVDLEGSAEDIICYQIGDVGYCNPSACPYSMSLGRS